MAEHPIEAPIRVGHVVLCMDVAGLEMFVARLIRHHGAAIEPTVYCTDHVGALGEELRAEGVDVVLLGRRPGTDLGMCDRLGKAARARGTEVFHAHGYTPFFAATVARLRGAWKTRVVVTEHGRPVEDVVSTKRRWANRLVLGPLAHEINSCSRFGARALIEKDGFPPGRVSVVPNGIELRAYDSNRRLDAARAAVGFDPNRRVIMNVARMAPIKDHRTLVTAFAMLATRMSDVDLTLVGDGQEREALEALARSLGIAPRVRFLGVRRDVPELLQAADLFVLSSLREAAPLSVLEAMASGVPVVATDVGGVGEMVTDGVHGRLAPPNDAEALAQAMGQSLTEVVSTGEMARRAVSRVHEDFDFETCARRHMERYRRVLGREEVARPAAVG